MKITAVVLTKNEEKNIEKCLNSVKFVDEIIVVDDFSTDKTLEIVHKVLKVSKVYKVIQRKLNSDFAEQRNFGLSKAKNDWVLFVDADEIVTDNLKKEILESKLDKESYSIPRRDFFWGKELRYGETRKVRESGLIRLVRKDSGKWLGTVHEIFHTSRNTGKMGFFLDHYPHPTLIEFIQKINTYSSLRAEELFTKGKNTNIFQIIFWPLGKFIYNYFFNLGFLDGPPGFAYSFLMSFHSFLVRAKLYQLRNLSSRGALATKRSLS